ncbi:hypothetical protein Tco_1571736, partial [Tanacetum coccineum]
MHCRIGNIPMVYKGLIVVGFLNIDEDVLLSTYPYSIGNNTSSSLFKNLKTINANLTDPAMHD